MRNWAKHCDESSDEGRFWSKVNLRVGECWLWTGAKDGNGYGLFFLRGRSQRAHRAVWQFMYGPIPAGLHVLHRCDVPACVHPEHLFLGTNRENIQDRTAKGRSASGERGRHRLTLAQVEDIRRRWNMGGVSQSALGREYGVSSNAIRHIVLGMSWHPSCTARMKLKETADAR